jgi:hypothetical protein
MKCPRCGFENPNDVKFCQQCGLSRVKPTASIMQPATPMGFHNFYAVLMLIIGILGLGVSCIGIISGEEFAEMGIAQAFVSSYQLIMAILLLNKKKIGLILRLIRDIWQIFMAACGILAMVGATIIILVIGATAVTELEALLNITLVFCIVLVFLWIVGCSLRIVWHAFLIKYYEKRKYLFK